MSNQVSSCIYSAFIAAALLMGGCCCGPMGSCGPGGCVTDCHDCEGGGVPMAYGPLQHLNRMRKSLVCGGGCGEVYYGEWQSTPPDACDPCCDDQFVGGAVPCQPFCWRPGAIFGFLTGIYGQRFCEGSGTSAGTCGCGVFDNSCGGGCSSGCGCDSGVVSSGNYESGNCATCNSTSASRPSTRIAKPHSMPQSRQTARLPNTRYSNSNQRIQAATQYR
ncbi:MAG: hypothetical protein AAGA30_21060 [Planctomycetota bacterium]